MTRNTTNYGWTVPVDSDPIAQGATVLGAAFDKVDAQTMVPSDSLTADVPYTSWPLGWSVMNVSSAATALAGNWPNTTVIGAVYTLRLSGKGWQFYFAATSPTNVYFRWYGSGAQAWQSILPGNSYLPVDSIAADLPSGSWPLGMSYMAVTSANSGTLNYPMPGNAGSVTTWRGSGSQYQLYMVGNPPNILFRWFGSTPGAWQTIFPPNTNLAANAFTADSPSTSWPLGFSHMPVSDPTGTNFPGTGSVLTSRNSTGSVSYQIFQATSGPYLYYRWYGTNPGPWLTIIGPEKFSQVAGGSIAVGQSAAAGATTQVTVTLPANRFTSSPRLYAQAASRVPGVVTTGVADSSTTSFSLYLYSQAAIGAAGVTVYWQANVGAT